MSEKTIKKINARQTSRLIEVLGRTSFYEKSSKGGKPMLDWKFIQALKKLFCSPRSQDVRRAINAFKGIDQVMFEGIGGNCDLVTDAVKMRIKNFLIINLDKKGFIKAQKELGLENGNKPGSFAAVPLKKAGSTIGASHIHPQLTSPLSRKRSEARV